MTGWLPADASEWWGRPVARRIGAARPRQRAVLVGVVREVTVRRDGDGAAVGGTSLDAVLDDGSGTLTLRWLGRDAVGGVVAGAAVAVEGTVADSHGRLVLLNPLYRFVASCDADVPPRPSEAFEGGAQDGSSSTS